MEFPGNNFDLVENKTDQIKKGLESHFGKMINIKRIPSPWEEDEFYEVMTFETEDGKYFAKWKEKGFGDVEYEYQLNFFLDELWLPVAKPLYLNKSLWVAVFDCLEGRECTEKDFEKPVFIKQIAKLLKELHAINPKTINSEFIKRKEGDNFADFMARYFQERIKLYQETENKPIVPFKKIKAAFNQLLQSCLYDGITGLCRFDLHAFNWFLSQEKVYLIDNEITRFLDISYDIFQVIDKIIKGDVDKLELFSENYGKEQFEKLNDPIIHHLYYLLHGIGDLCYLKTLTGKNLDWKNRAEEMVRKGVCFSENI